MAAVKAHYVKDAISMSSLSPLVHPDEEDEKKEKKKKKKDKKDEDVEEGDEKKREDVLGEEVVVEEEKKKKKKNKNKESEVTELTDEEIVKIQLSKFDLNDKHEVPEFESKK